MALCNFFVRTAQVSALLAAFSIASHAQAAGAKKGGTLVFGRGADSVGLDPANRTDGESLNVTDHIFDSLLVFKPGTTEVIPSLAEKWEVSKDNKSFTFNLRKGVKFHDGEPMNADSVIFSFMRQKDPKHPAHASAAPYAYFTDLGLDTLITAITKIDDHTVKFELSKPYAPFLSCLAMQSFAIVSPKALTKLMKDFAFNPVGTGPFKMTKWEKNQKIVLTANDDYWGGRPSLDTVVFRSIPDNSTRLMEMMAGKIHVMDNPNPDDISVLEKKLGNKVKIAKQPGFNIGYLAMNQEKKPFDDVRVRRAINHAINKKGIIDAVYAGYAEPAKNPMPPTMWGYNDAITGYEYNPEKAKALLKEAGVKEATSLHAKWP